MHVRILCALLFPLVTVATTQIKVPAMRVLQSQLEKKGLSEFCNNTSFVEEVAGIWQSLRSLKATVEHAIETYVNEKGEGLTKRQRYDLRRVLFGHQVKSELLYERLRKKKLIVSVARNDDWV